MVNPGGDHRHRPVTEREGGEFTIDTSHVGGLKDGFLAPAVEHGGIGNGRGELQAQGLKRCGIFHRLPQNTGP